MRTARAVLAPLALVVVYLTTTNCFTDIFAPCDAGELSLNPNLGFLDDIWTLATINGAPIPASGFRIPNSKDNSTLRAGSMQFATRKLTGGTCKNPTSSSGVVAAKYLLGNSNGVPKQGSSAAGSFDYNKKTGLITLTAFNKTLPGYVAGGNMTFIGPVIEDDIPSIITLVLRRAGSTP